MRRHRPTGGDLDVVPWHHPDDREPRVRWNREWFYGQLTITHWDGDAMLRVGMAVAEYLRDILPPAERGSLDVAWLHHDNGRTLLDAVMDPATGGWRAPRGGDDRSGWGEEAADGER